MKRNVEEGWLVAVQIDENREIFVFPTQENAQLFFDEVKNEVDDIYMATTPVYKKK